MLARMSHGLHTLLLQVKAPAGKGPPKVASYLARLGGIGAWLHGLFGTLVYNFDAMVPCQPLTHLLLKSRRAGVVVRHCAALPLLAPAEQQDTIRQILALRQPCSKGRRAVTAVPLLT